MLEHATLHIHGWTRSTQPDGAEAWTRPITGAAGQPLGFVRSQKLTAHSWFFWLRKLRLDVFETEDASHLMSLTRSWTMRSIWDLHDAEERHVGYVYPASLVASEGGLLGFLHLEARGQGRILDHAGRVLTRFASNNADPLAVSFGPGPADNPFLRMLILGCILTLDPKPNGD